MRSKICLAVCFILILNLSVVFAASHEKNFDLFEKSILDEANKIRWGTKYNFQDTEFIEDEMDGDETVYQRACYDDHYVLIRKYDDKTWSKSYISHFWTDSDALAFTRGIKAGSSFDEVKAFFGDSHLIRKTFTKKYYVYKFEEDSDAARGVIIFSVNNNRVESISYYAGSHETSNMGFLFNLYSSLLFADVTGDNVNVREEGGYPGKDKVLFRVSRSKGDSLLVGPEGPGEDWCYVCGRIVNGSLRHVPSSYISRQFVKTRSLTQSERKKFFSQYIK